MGTTYYMIMKLHVIDGAGAAKSANRLTPDQGVSSLNNVNSSVT